MHEKGEGEVNCKIKKEGGEEVNITELRRRGGEGNEEWEKGEEAVNSEIEEEQEKRR